jgi:hypothetical protein
VAVTFCQFTLTVSFHSLSSRRSLRASEFMLSVGQSTHSTVTQAKTLKM